MPEAYQFCTLFDRNYLLKGVVMLRSLARHCPGAQVHVLCMDGTTQDLLQRLAIPGVRTIALPAVEDDEVLAAKTGRSIAEYCWTLAPVLLWHVLQRKPDVASLTYLDADLMFCSPVAPLLDEIAGASIAAIEHRYTPRLAHLEVCGRFNVQWVTFRRDADGMACLSSWRSQCLQWCYARVEDGKLGDQKYLDAWPQAYASFHAVRHIGAGVAPWNFPNYRFASRDGMLHVDEVPLVFYHFHQFQLLEGGGYDYLSSIYRADGDPPEAVYRPYCDALEATLAEVRRLQPGWRYGLRPRSTIALRRAAQRLLPLRLKNALHRIGIGTW